MQELRTCNIIDFSHTRAAPLLEKCEYPWQCIPLIKDFITALGPTLDKTLYDHPQKDVWIAKNAVVAPTASIGGPCIIGENTEIRHCAFIRSSALIGDGAVIGNSCELKNCIISDGAQIPHFNYVGDSVLGFRAHFGAGVITSNVKSDKTSVTVHNGTNTIPTNLSKFGAAVGDRAEIGCNSVLNPGTVIGRDSRIYPLSCVRTTVPQNSIYKSQDNIIPVDKIRLP